MEAESRVITLLERGHVPEKPLAAGKGKEVDSPPLKVHSLADSFWNADPQKYKRMNLFCFKPLNLW